MLLIHIIGGVVAFVASAVTSSSGHDTSGMAFYLVIAGLGAFVTGAFIRAACNWAAEVLRTVGRLEDRG